MDKNNVCTKYQLDKYFHTMVDDAGYGKNSYGGGTMGGIRLNQPWSFSRSQFDIDMMKKFDRMNNDLKN